MQYISWCTRWAQRPHTEKLLSTTLYTLYLAEIWKIWCLDPSLLCARFTAVVPSTIITRRCVLRSTLWLRVWPPAKGSIVHTDDRCACPGCSTRMGNTCRTASAGSCALAVSETATETYHADIRIGQNTSSPLVRFFRICSNLLPSPSLRTSLMDDPL